MPASDRVALVTGATSGIGKEVARGLAERGFQVGLVARDEAKGRAVLEELRASADGDRLDLFIADLEAQAQVRRLAGEVLVRYERLHVLVNNAGGLFARFALTGDGIERTFALNHFAYFLLTELLLPSLRAAAPARVVSVASAVHSMAALDVADLSRRTPPAGGYTALGRYAQSKLANVLFTYELARRLEGSGVTANCLHPGVVRTGFGRGGGPLFNAGFQIASPVFRSPKQGADTALWLATAPEVATRSGEYFVDRAAQSSSALSHDRDLAARLWSESARLTGVE